MPNRDGTGPIGSNGRPTGPMTGRKMGSCVPKKIIKKPKPKPKT